MPWDKLVHLGDIELTLPVAAAIGAWLLAARAWRMAFCWGLLFALGIGLVGATKVAFMAWGMSLAALEFKAVSGHATGVTAVFPTMFYLLLQHRGTRARTAALGAGLALGALMAVLLVALDEHSVAEAAAGWLLGAAVSLGTVRLAGPPPPRNPSYGLVFCGLVLLSAAWFLRKVPLGYLMIRTAVRISGNCAPFPWNAGG